MDPKSIASLHSLYSSPTAQIVLQGHKSDPFPISSGTRRGCPLSPLLFVIAIENLATAIRQNPDIQGIKSGGRSHKCALFADDMLLFITSPTPRYQIYCPSWTVLEKKSGLNSQSGQIGGSEYQLVKFDFREPSVSISFSVVTDISSLFSYFPNLQHFLTL